MYDVVAIGDGMIDAFLSIHDASAHARLNKKDCELCVTHGEKILVDSCCFLLGGGACNVAVGLSRSGNNTGLFIETGDDEFSQKIINTLKKENVDLSLVQQTKGAAASFGVGLSFKGERTLFVEHVRRKHDFNIDAVDTQWILLEGLGHEWEKAYGDVSSYIEKGKAKLALAIGSTQLEEGAEILPQLIAKADVLFVNKEEAKTINSWQLTVNSKENNANDINQILQSLQKMGAKIVSLTDGERGSYVIDENGQIYILGKFPCEIVEKTGAGDAYASGFLSAIMSNKSVLDAMRWGAVSAASVIEHIGAQEGLLSRTEIEKRLAAHSEFNGRVI